MRYIVALATVLLSVFHASGDPAGACCACICTQQPMARRLRLLTHGLKIARRAPRASVNHPG